MAVASVGAAQSVDRGRIVLVAGACLAAAAGLGLLTGTLAIGNRLDLIFVVLALTLPALVWRSEGTPIVIPALIAVLVEEYTSHWADATTDRLPLWKSLSDGAGFSGVYLNPAELIILVAGLAWLARGIVVRKIYLPRSPLAIGIVLIALVAIAAEVHGLARGGVFNRSLWELRPWIYLAVMFLLTSQIAKLSTARSLLWIIVLGSGFKGIQGTVRFILLGNVQPRPEAILEHVEALFFGCFIAATAALWLFGVRGRLRVTATALLPFVLFAEMANNRRAAWPILAASMLVIGALAWIRLPARRRLLLGLGVAGILAAGVYLPIFWSSSGLVGQPARAVRSMIEPDSRDAASNQYRVLEDLNLGINIRRSPVFGAGFGIPIDNAVNLYDLTALDPSIAYIQHNNVLYLWWRMGIIGEALFWWLIGSGTIAACVLARRAEPYWGVYCAVTICALIGFAIDGWYDMALTSLRAPVLIGCLLGGLEALPRLLAVPAAERVAPGTRVLARRDTAGRRFSLADGQAVAGGVD